MIEELLAPPSGEIEVQEEAPPPPNPPKAQWVWTWIVPLAIFGGFLSLYLSTHTRWYTFDSVAYATRIRNFDTTPKAGYLVHPHHLLFNSLGYGFWKVLGAAGIHVSTIEATQIMNSLMGAALLAVFYRLLLLRGFRWRGPPVEIRHWPIVEIAATVALGCTFGYWSISTDGRVNAPALLMLVVAIGYAWGAIDHLRWGQIWICAAATVLAVGMHQSHGLVLAFCALCFLLAWAPLREQMIASGSYLLASIGGIGLLYAIFGFIVMGHGSIAEIQRWSLSYSDDGRWWKLDFWNNFIEKNTQAYVQSFVAGPPLPNEAAMPEGLASAQSFMRGSVIPILVLLLVTGCVIVGLRAWRRRSDPGWRRSLALLGLALPYTVFFTIWDPGYWVFWLPMTVATLILAASILQTAPLWARISATVALLAWAGGSIAVNGEASFFRRMQEKNNPELVAIKNLGNLVEAGDLLITTGIGSGAKFEVYSPYFADLTVSVAHMELKRAGGDFTKARKSIRQKVQRAWRAGKRVYIAREFYADIQWETIGKRYALPESPQRKILEGYDRIEVSTGTPVRVFYLEPVRPRLVPIQAGTLLLFIDGTKAKP